MYLARCWVCYSEAERKAEEKRLEKLLVSFGFVWVDLCHPKCYEGKYHPTRHLNISSAWDVQVSGEVVFFFITKAQFDVWWSGISLRNTKKRTLRTLCRILWYLAVSRIFSTSSQSAASAICPIAVFCLWHVVIYIYIYLLCSHDTWYAHTCISPDTHYELRRSGNGAPASCDLGCQLPPTARVVTLGYIIVCSFRSQSFHRHTFALICRELEPAAFRFRTKRQGLHWGFPQTNDASERVSLQPVSERGLSCKVQELSSGNSVLCMVCLERAGCHVLGHTVAPIRNVTLSRCGP